MYEMIQGSSPFYSENPMLIMKRILEMDLNFDDDFDIDALDIIDNLM